MRFFTKVSALLVLLGTAGCQPAERDQVAEKGRQAFESARQAGSLAFDSMRRETERIASAESEKQLEAARKRAIELQSELANMKLSDLKSKLKLEAVQKQLAQIDAAKAVADARKELEKAGQKTSTAYQNAQRRLTETTNAARKAWNAFDKAPEP